MIGRPPSSTLFPSPTLFRSNEAAEASIGGAVGGERQQARMIGEIEPCPDDELDVMLARRLEGAHHAGEAVAIGHRHGPHAVDRKSTRLNSRHPAMPYATFLL